MLGTRYPCSQVSRLAAAAGAYTLIADTYYIVLAVPDVPAVLPFLAVSPIVLVVLVVEASSDLS